MWTPYSEKSGKTNPDRLDLRLSDRVSRLFFHSGLQHARGELEALAEQGRKLALVTDQNVWRSLPDAERSWLSVFPRHELPAGEISKSLGALGGILDFLADQRLDRQSVVIALGGGVVGDIAGFASAIYLRGVSCYQIPTSLLAMVDSSVGGKTGINLDAGKNLVGAFHQPQAVFIATDFLKTLPVREFRAGLAEVLKYGLLGDASFWRELVEHPLKSAEDPRLPAVIAHCCAMKAAVVEADEKETAKEGGRALLNLGHTFGHAIEKVCGYGEYLHGEAIAIGLVAAARYSEKQYGWDRQQAEEIEQTLVAHGLPVRLSSPLAVEELIGAMHSDKKNRKGQIRLVLMEAPGKAITFTDVREDWIRECWGAVSAVTPN